MRPVLQSLKLVCIGIGFLSLAGCGLDPELLLSRGPLVAFPVNTYTALGDSITAGATLSSQKQSFAALIAHNRGWAYFNFANRGDSACDLFPRQILPHRVAVTGKPGIAYTLLIGTNDADNRGTGAYEPIFQACHLAALTWVGTRPEDRLLPGDPAVAATGDCTATSGSAMFSCRGNGTLFVSSFSTTGAPLYIWYSLDNNAASDAAFTVTVDNQVSAVNVHTLPPVPVATQNESNIGVSVVRLAAPGGSHSIRITSVGSVNILALGTNRAVKPIAVAAGDIPNQRRNAPYAPVVTQLAYTAIIRANIATAIEDGLDVRPVPNRDVMLGSAVEMNDPVHPNKLGQQRLAQAFAASLP